MRREERLTRRSDFQMVYGSGSSVADRLIVLYSLPRPDELRLGISVSKKVSRGSVGRNRLKRLVRAAFRQLRPNIPRGHHLIVIVRVAAKEASYEQILESLTKLLRRAGLFVNAES